MSSHAASLARANSRHRYDAFASEWNSVVFALLATIGLGSCLRAFVCFEFNPVHFLFSDPARHWLNGGHFPWGAYTGASDPIGYQLYLFLVRKLSFDNRYVVAFSSALLSVVMPWTYYRAARTFGLQKVPALWVWALIVWTPSLVAIYHFFMMETLLLLVDGFALWATARYLRKGGRWAFLLVVFLWTAAVLTKPTIGPFAAVCVQWSYWKRRQPLKTIAVAAAMVIVMMIPQSIRSKVALGFVAPFGNPWMTQIQYRSNAMRTQMRFYSHTHGYVRFKPSPLYEITFTSPTSFTRPFSPFSNWIPERGRSAKIAVIIIYSAYGERDWRNAYKHFRPDTGLALRLWRENVIMFLFSPSWPEGERLAWIDTWESPLRWMWAPIVLFVLVGNAWLFIKRHFDLIPVATTCLTLVLALQNVVIFEGRYRKPLEPLLILNVVWIVATWTAQRTQSKLVSRVAEKQTSQTC